MLRAQALADFGELNARLTEGGFFGARRFQIKRGDLTVGDELRARNVELVVDGGSLTVNGRIDASGPQVGSIRLAAMGDLVINGALDAHSTTLRVDSYGKIIDSANRAIVDLTSRTGTLSLGAGAQVDLRAGVGAQNNDGVARGTLDLNARRLGGGAERGAIAGSGNGANDVAVSVAGTPLIQGAKTVAVNAFRRYDDAPLAAAPDVTGKRPQEITQGYLDGIDGENQTYMNAALANPAVAARLAGLGAYKLRPGVEVVSATPDGDLTVSGDIDLSNYRYGPGADRLTPARRGYGEPGVLVLRAGGNLNIYGSINDGFGPPPESPDDAGWQLVQGRLGSQGITAFGGDLVVPIGGVKLEAGTMFPTGSKLNYDLPVAPVTLPAGTVLPVAMTLDAALSLPTGLVLTGDVTAADGRVLRAGTVLAGELKLAPGAQLGAGFVLRGEAAVRAFTWPKGVPLPTDLKASAQITLAQGSLIPSQTKLVLLGGKPVDLRPKGPDGRQGRNWALAPMLGAGASAWTLTAVAGADLGSTRRAHAQRPEQGRSGDVRHALWPGGPGNRDLQDHLCRRDGADAAGGRGTDRRSLAGWQADQADRRRMAAGLGNDVFLGRLLRTGTAQGDGCRIAAMGGQRHLGRQDGAGNGRRAQQDRGSHLRQRRPLRGRRHLGNHHHPHLQVRLRLALVQRAAHRRRRPVATGRARRGHGLAVRRVHRRHAHLAGRTDARFNLARGYDGKTGVLGLMQLDGKYDAALASYRAWYPDHGGNLLVDAARDVYGDAMGAAANSGVEVDWTSSLARYSSTMTGAWLWRQGSIGTPGVADIAPSWWINFGAYTVDSPTAPATRNRGWWVSPASARWAAATSASPPAATRACATARRRGALCQRHGGALARADRGGRQHRPLAGRQPGADRRRRSGPAHRRQPQSHAERHPAAGDRAVAYGWVRQPGSERRAWQPARPDQPVCRTDGRHGPALRRRLGIARSGSVCRGRGPGHGRAAPGAGRRRGLDRHARRPGAGRRQRPYRVTQVNSSPYQMIGAADPVVGGGNGWFTLWTPSTAINLFSTGGNLTPMTVSNSRFLGEELSSDVTRVSADYRRYFVYPSIVRAVAVGGNIVLADNAAGYDNPVLLLAPSAGGQLEMLAGRSILANGAHAVSMSAYDAPLPTPWRPAFSAFEVSNGNPILTNTSKDGVQPGSLGYNKPLFVFGPASPTNRALHAGDDTVARFYAVTGDILGLKSGAVVDMSNTDAARTPGTRPPCRYRCGRAATSCAWMSPRCTTMRATCR
ncbi:hypothetical protein WJ970_10880 [Achromobacter xylosoxidans]